MANVGKRGSVRGIRALARRVYLRWSEYKRRHPGASAPINDTLSRIFEHEPAYIPFRPRSENKQRPPLQNPGIFTVLEDVADTLETTVGDLLGEPGYKSARDLISTADRRKLRQVTKLLRELFDLDDESLDAEENPRDEYKFVVTPEEFIERDHDYPRTLHAWVVPEVPAAAGQAGAEADFTLATTQVLHSIREVWDSRLQVIRVVGDSMEPELRSGWKILVDTQLTHPTIDALVAVYVKDEGGVLGRWLPRDGEIKLRKSNPSHDAFVLGDPAEWTLWGTVTKIVEAPVPITGMAS